MPRPTNKKELLDVSEVNFRKLLDFINSLPDEYKNKTWEHDELNDRDKTVSDVICHLHEWHLMMAGWYKIGMAGDKPAIPAADVTWQTLPVLNRRIHARYKCTELEKALALIRESHADVMALVEKHNDDELFTRRKYPWTGTTSLGAYFISATSSHYDWGLKTIRPIRKLMPR